MTIIFAAKESDDYRNLKEGKTTGIFFELKCWKKCCTRNQIMYNIKYNIITNTAKEVPYAR
jgi:hypothetical protein